MNKIVDEFEDFNPPCTTISELSAGFSISEFTRESTSRRFCARAEPVDASALARAAGSLLLPFLDPISYGHSHLDGRKAQVPRTKLNRHFAAQHESKYSFNATSNSRDFIKHLSRKDIERHLCGKPELLVRSAWLGARLLVRFDADEHNGESDALLCLEQIRGDFLPRMYLCRSKRGWSGYLWLAVPIGFNEGSGKLQPTCTLKEMNHLRSRLHDATSALTAALGFRCGVEVHGSFLERVHGERELNGVPISPDTVAEGALGPGTTVKLPTFKASDDIHRLSRAVVNCHPRMLDHVHFSDAGLFQLLTQGLAAHNEQEAVTARRAARQRIEENKFTLIQMSEHRLEAACDALKLDTFDLNNAAQVQRILDWRPPQRPTRQETSRSIIGTGDKPKDAFACVVRARLLLRVVTRFELEAKRDAVIELAHELYEENRLSSNARDKDRENRFGSAFKFILQTFTDGPTGKGNDIGWFDEEHIAALECKFRSNPAVARKISDFNCGQRKRKQSKLTYRHLAVVACTLAKDSVYGKNGATNGEVPVAALKAMLSHPRFDMPAHGSIVAEATRIITKVSKCIECVERSVKRGWESINGVWTLRAGRAAAYVIRKLHWFSFLPQLVDAPRRQCALASSAPLETLPAPRNENETPFYFSSQYKGGSVGPWPLTANRAGDSGGSGTGILSSLAHFQ